MSKDKELKQLALSASERATLPLGFASINNKGISPKHVEQQITVRSEKFRKTDFFSLVVEKPISKF
jgi:hypothetical protein